MNSVEDITALAILGLLAITGIFLAIAEMIEHRKKK